MYGIGHDEHGPAYPETPKFKVGDAVRVVRDGYQFGGSYHNAAVGETYVINEIRGRIIKTNKWFFCVEEIERAFSVGDTVRLTRDGGVYKKGHRGTVTSINAERVNVLMDIGRYAVFHHDILERVERPKEPHTSDVPHIVAAVINGTPAPSPRPHVHIGLMSAVAEAERLSRVNPGKQFDIYQRVAGRVAEQHVEMKEVA